MTATIWPKEMVELFSPNYVAPVVGFLTSEDCPETGATVEAAAGWVGRYRWQRTFGYAVCLFRSSDLC